MPATPSSRPSGWMLMLLATAQLIIALDATIVFVALPQIGSHLGFSAQQLQWVVSAYTVAFGGFLLLGGRATDLLGKRRLYRVGQSLYALSSLAAVLGGSALLLVLARAVQGVGGALLFPATLALINTHYAEGPQRNRAFAVWSAASAAGLALGALLGGVLTQWWGWEAVFLVNVPLAGGCALAARYWIPADGERSRGRSFDLGGALTVTVGATLLVFALVQGPEWGWTAPATLGCMLLALVLLGLFAWIEHRGRDPLMPLRLLGYRELRMAMVLTAVFMSSFGVQYYFLALYYQQIYRYSVLQAGLAFLPATLVCTLGIWLAERALVKIGLRNTLVSGQLAGGAGDCPGVPGATHRRGILVVVAWDLYPEPWSGHDLDRDVGGRRPGCQAGGTGCGGGHGLDHATDRRSAGVGGAGVAGQCQRGDGGGSSPGHRVGIVVERGDCAGRGRGGDAAASSTAGCDSRSHIGRPQLIAF